MHSAGVRTQCPDTLPGTPPQIAHDAYKLAQDESATLKADVAQQKNANTQLSGRMCVGRHMRPNEEKEKQSLDAHPDDNPTGHICIQLALSQKSLEALQDTLHVRETGTGPPPILGSTC